MSRTVEIIEAIREELGDHARVKVKSDDTLLIKANEAQEYFCEHCMALKKTWDISLKSGTLLYPFDDGIVKLVRIFYNKQPFLKYSIIQQKVYSFGDVTITGDALNQMSELVITGASMNNTSNGILWWTISTGILQVWKTEAADKEALVMSSDLNIIGPTPGPQRAILLEENSSGMSGSVLISGIEDDTDQANNKFTFELIITRRGVELWDNVTIAEGDKLRLVTYVKPKPEEKITEEFEPILDSSFDKLIRKYVLSYYNDLPLPPSKGGILRFDKKDAVIAEAKDLAVQINVEDIATSKKQYRNKLYLR